ncbi:hypothetical protein OUZ56_006108 [Daphnia magna]|uniref:Uncharacterized protein n=1 Tax=Daphnia magna TaxID=35525 RepID=A0ABQ9YUM9_9CRUS|nr:hypothetical protein OUZ56_006108 [Daphnia magna]
MMLWLNKNCLPRTIRNSTLTQLSPIKEILKLQRDIGPTDQFGPRKPKSTTELTHNERSGIVTPIGKKATLLVRGRDHPYHVAKIPIVANEEKQIRYTVG